MTRIGPRRKRRPGCEGAIFVLQQLYGNLSDEEMEYCLLDRMSWQSFTGLARHRHLPDTRTIWAFMELLAKEGGAEALFEIVGEQLAAGR